MNILFQFKGSKEEKEDLLMQVEKSGLKHISKYIRSLLGFGQNKIEREVWLYYFKKKQKQKEKKNIIS